MVAAMLSSKDTEVISFGTLSPVFTAKPL